MSGSPTNGTGARPRDRDPRCWAARGRRCAGRL